MGLRSSQARTEIKRKVKAIRKRKAQRRARRVRRIGDGR
jgi:hypothetical protein